MRIRRAGLLDAARILEIYSPYVQQSSVTFEYDVPALEEFQERMRGIMAEYPYLVCEDEMGKVQGYAYAHRAQERAAYGWNAELSVYLDKNCQGKGVGTRLYEALTKILRLQNVQNLYALITSPNEKSEALHEKMGFACSGRYTKTGFKAGAWRDVLLYEKIIGKHECPPPPFLPFPQIPEEVVQEILAS